MTDRMSKADYDRLTRPRERNTMHALARRVSVGEDLVTVLEFPAGRSVEELLENLAALVLLTSANRSADPDQMGRRNADRGVNLQPAIAARRLENAIRNLHAEAESVASFLNHPWHVDDRQRSKQRVWCQKPGCDRFRTRLPKWARSGDSWVALFPVCNGTVDGKPCVGRLTDA